MEALYTRAYNRSIQYYQWEHVSTVIVIITEVVATYKTCLSLLN